MDILLSLIWALRYNERLAAYKLLWMFLDYPCAQNILFASFVLFVSFVVKK
jgi:hypothetical protein